MHTLRPLTSDEIKTLRRNACRASDWRSLTVARGFSADGIRDAEFSGAVTLGANCRIARAVIANADIGDNVLIQNTAFIGETEQTQTGTGTGNSAFGNGSPVHVVAEDGARSVPLWRGLSSQWAHVILHCKGTPVAEALEQMIRDDVETIRSGGAWSGVPARTRIGAGCGIRFSGMIRNVRLGEGTRVESAAALSDVYTASGADGAGGAGAGVFIGEGVAAACCVFQRASRADGGVRLKNCLVGEGARLANALSAEHSLFFANADFALGEALSLMAGPFSVSHHKATLALACQTSFSNFGSGSNASNHAFKLGPRHGGILRRGARCGSGSYLFWPSDIGAFTTVVGKHRRRLDTADFPFSLVTTDGDGTILVPGANLFTAGLFRDERKWKSRDRRSGIAQPRDYVETAVLSPYTMEAAERGLEILRRHKAATAGASGAGAKDLVHHGAVIPASRVDAGIALYEAALVYYRGRVLLENGIGLNSAVNSAGVSKTAPETPSGAGGWRDWGGMLVPGERAETFLRDVAEKRIAGANAVDAAFADMHEAFRNDELQWVLRRWRKEYAEKWPETVDFAFARQMRDAAKEFSEEAAYGFGVEENARESFLRARGRVEEDDIVKALREERDRLERTHARRIHRTADPVS